MKYKYFVNYDGLKDCFFIKKVDKNNYKYNSRYKKYILNDYYIYDEKNMVFNTEKEALQDLKYTSKEIIKLY